MAEKKEFTNMWEEPTLFQKFSKKKIEEKVNRAWNEHEQNITAWFGANEASEILKTNSHVAINLAGMVAKAKLDVAKVSDKMEKLEANEQKARDELAKLQHIHDELKEDHDVLETINAENLKFVGVFRANDNELRKQKLNDIETIKELTAGKNALADENRQTASMLSQEKMAKEEEMAAKEKLEKAINDHMKRADDAEARMAMLNEDINKLNKMGGHIKTLEAELDKNKVQANYFENELQRVTEKANAKVEKAKLNEKQRESIDKTSASLMEKHKQHLEEMSMLTEMQKTIDADTEKAAQIRDAAMKDRAEADKLMANAKSQGLDNSTLAKALNDRAIELDAKAKELEQGYDNSRHAEFGTKLGTEAKQHFQLALHAPTMDEFILKRLETEIGKTKRKYIEEYPEFKPEAGDDGKELTGLNAEMQKHPVLRDVDNMLNNFREHITGKRPGEKRKKKGAGYDDIYGANALKDMRKRRESGEEFRKGLDSIGLGDKKAPIGVDLIR